MNVKAHLRRPFDFTFGKIRQLYEWVLNWAHKKYHKTALFVLAFFESSFFPIPPDVLQIALSVSRPAKAFIYAAVSTAGSVLGALLGYAIGLFLFESVGMAIIAAFGAEEKFAHVGELYTEFAFIAVLVSAFTPIPYKVFTIAAGVFQIGLPVLVVASLLGRGARFGLIAIIFYFFGPKMKEFIEQYFNILTVIGTALLIGGIVVLKYVL